MQSRLTSAGHWSTAILAGAVLILLAVQVSAGAWLDDHAAINRVYSAAIVSFAAGAAALVFVLAVWSIFTDKSRGASGKIFWLVVLLFLNWVGAALFFVVSWLGQEPSAQSTPRQHGEASADSNVRVPSSVSTPPS